MSETLKIESRQISFLDIFSEHIGCRRILIPAIQRDYAQGRKSVDITLIRERFVGQLRKYLLDGQTHSLDFVYGSADGDSFIPLEGQQRLTTLMLLHLYLFAIEGKTELIRMIQFSYETRETTRRFCEALLREAPTLFSRDALSRNIPSQLICDMPWWFNRWANDPSVAGMLVTLDEIHNRFFDISISGPACKALTDGRPIVFDFLPLKGFHDIDDLYIKMNARGLPLTRFEVFKSKFIEDFEREFVSRPERIRELKAAIDVHWTDRLWKCRENGNRNIDHFFERIIRVLIANEAAALRHIAPNKNCNVEAVFDAKRERAQFSHSWYVEQGVKFDSDMLSRIFEDLSILLGASSPLATEASSICDPRWFDAADTLRRIMSIPVESGNSDSDSLDYRRRLQLHAYLRFIARFGVDGRLSEWNRLIHNLVFAKEIDSIDDMVRSLTSCETLLDDYSGYRKSSATTIDEWLAAKPQCSIGFFPDFQWEEEIVKACLRSNSSWVEPLDRAERHFYFNGQVACLLAVAGIIRQKTPFDAFKSFPDPTHFVDCIDRALPLFDEIGRKDSPLTQSHTMERALLALADYMSADGNEGRHNFYNDPGHRDYSWRRLFRIDNETKTAAVDALRELLWHPSYSSDSVATSLDNIASSAPATLPEWRRILCGSHGARIIGESRQGFFAFSGENCLIYKAKQRNHYHATLMTVELHYSLSDMGKISELKMVKNSEDDSCVTCNGCKAWFWNDVWYLSKPNHSDVLTIYSLADIIAAIQ